MDPLKPSITLLSKLGSIVVHLDEVTSPDGHAFDKAALDQLLVDPEVKAWVEAMHSLALLPKKRK
jgi:hypothetical protein